MSRVTALTLALNEEEMLGRCLSRLAWADELLVVDSGSTDRTAEIAAAAGARVVFHAFAGFADQCNFGLREARGDWILLIDADELVSPELRDSVLRVVSAPGSGDIHSLCRDSYVFGQRMRASSWSGEWVPRLFRKGAVTFSGLVHPDPNIGGRPVGRLDGKLIHCTYRSAARYFEKFELYSTLWAQNAEKQGRTTGPARAAAAALWRVFHNYFIRGEIRDGRVGAVMAVLAGMHTFIRHIKLWGLTNADAFKHFGDGEAENGAESK